MPKILGEISSKKKITTFAISKDWHTLTPWLHKNKPTGYFSVHHNLSESKNVLFTYWYLGPLSIVVGKWVA